MVGESQTQAEYDEAWDLLEDLLDSGILEDVIQKAEQKAKQSQLVPTNNNAGAQSQQPSRNLSVEAPICTIQPTWNLNANAGPGTSNLSSQQFRPGFHNSQDAHYLQLLPTQSFRPPAFLEPRAREVPSQAVPSQVAQHDAFQRQMSQMAPPQMQLVTPSLQVHLSNGGFSSQRAQLRHNSEFLAERNGTMSLHQANLIQQKELERLAMELSLKDQQVLEARRARDEKEDRLRAALDSAAALKEELESLKSLRQAEAAVDKRCREGGTEGEAGNRSSLSLHQEITPEAVNGKLNEVHPKVLSQKVVEKRSQARELNQEMWAAPWQTEDHNVVTRKASNSADSSDSVMLKAQNLQEGYITLIQKAKARSEAPQVALELQASELPPREPSNAVYATLDPIVQPVRPGRGLGLENTCSRSELSHSLLQIWNSEESHNKGAALVSEIFSVCRQDLYVLFTHEGSLKDVDPKQVGNSTSKSQNKLSSKPRQSLNHQTKKEVQDGIGSKLHNALVNVANKLTPSTSLLGPLLQYCNCSNVDLVRSALHVLNCTLRLDSLCREKILASDKIDTTGMDVNSDQDGKNQGLERLNLRHVGVDRSHSSSVPFSKEQVAVPVYFSPRVICHTSESHNQILTTSTSTHGHSEKQSVPRRQEGSLVPYLGKRNLNAFLEWLLDLALHSSSSAIRFEATAILDLLVVHSQPSIERAHYYVAPGENFKAKAWEGRICRRKLLLDKLSTRIQIRSLRFGPLLWNGGLASLLKASAGGGVQLQAVRMVHLLLHCSAGPLLLQIFCFTHDSINVGQKWNDTPDEGKAKDFLAAEAQNDFSSKGTQAALLDSLASCLAYMGNSLKEYMLRRNVVRLLTFLASSGEVATSILVHIHLNHIKAEQCALKDSNNTTEGVTCLQSEQSQGAQNAGLPVMNTVKSGKQKLKEKLSHVNGVADQEQIVLSGGETCCTIPWRLILLLANELKAEEDETTNNIGKMGCAEDRACLIIEALALLCKLASDSTHSSTVLASLTASKEIGRLVLGTLTQLISRNSRAQSSVSPELVELARGLQKQVIVELGEDQKKASRLASFPSP